MRVVAPARGSKRLRAQQFFLKFADLDSVEARGLAFWALGEEEREHLRELSRAFNAEVTKVNA